jgi:hypothetical protein
VADEQRSWWRGRPALAIAGAVLLAGLAWLWWKGAEWLYQNNTMNADRLKATTDTRTALIAGLAAVGALGTFWVSAKTQQFTAETLRISQKNYELAQRGQFTDRYAKAIEQLGHAASPDVPDVRLGGIYALKQLATDNPEDQATIVEVLSAFVRMHSDPIYRYRTHPFLDRGEKARKRGEGAGRGRETRG